MTAREHTAVKVRSSDVIGFRLAAHHLAHRKPGADLLEAAGACAIQNSPPGSAAAALHARVEEVAQDRIDALVGEDKSLLQTWCMRGAPFFFPTADAPVFTTGVLPDTEAARLHLIIGVEHSVKELGMGLDEAVALTAAEIETVLTGRQLAINELGEELAARIADALSPAQREIWLAMGPHAPNQPLGEAVVHFCLRILTLRGILCLAPRRGNRAPFVLVEEWLGTPLPKMDPARARAALLRRYLHCYGPSTRTDFAGWAGVRTGDTDPWWTALEDELTPVDFGRGRKWLLTEDLDALKSPPETRGVRLLPPRDPYTQLRDRETIVDKRYHREVWKTVGEPGTVLVDGAIGGIWRPRKSGRNLALAITAFRGLNNRVRKQVHAEAEQLAHLRGASAVRVEFEDAGA